MIKSILLIGLGRFGKHIALNLNQLGHEVMAVDKDEEKVESVLPFVTNAQIGDSSNEDFLKSLGIDDYDVCIVAIGSDFQSSLETTSLLKELGGKVVVSRAARDVQAKFLLRNGADEIIYPEKQIAEWAAIRYSANHILDYIRLDKDYAVFQIAIPDSWLGKTVGQVDVRKKHNVSIVALKEGSVIDIDVNSETVFEKDKTLMVLGKFKNIQRCFNI